MVYQDTYHYGGNLAMHYQDIGYPIIAQPSFYNVSILLSHTGRSSMSTPSPFLHSTTVYVLGNIDKGKFDKFDNFDQIKTKSI